MRPKLYVHQVEGDGRCVILDLPAEAVRQLRVPLHPQVLTLEAGRGDVLRIRIARHVRSPCCSRCPRPGHTRCGPIVVSVRSTMRSSVPGNRSGRWAPLDAIVESVPDALLGSQVEWCTVIAVSGFVSRRADRLELLVVNQPQQRRNPDGYSSRSASTGATLDARSAGSNDAASTVARDMAAAISSVRESPGAMP